MDDIIKGLLYMLIILGICSVLSGSTKPKQVSKNPFTTPREVHSFTLPIMCTD